MADPISSPPALPDRKKVGFSDKFSAWLTWFTGPFISQFNAAINAINLFPVQSTSTTSVSIGSVGNNRTLFFDPSKSFALGMNVKIASSLFPVNWMQGDVIAYNSTTGEMTITIQQAQGSGTFSAWTISLAYGGATNTGPDVQNQVFVGVATGGSNTAYTVSPSPAFSSYAAFQSLFVNFNAASGNDPTLEISGLISPPNLVKQLVDGTFVNIKANDIPINHRSRVTLLSASQALVENLPPVKSEDYIYIRDEKSSGTNGGTFTAGGWRKRDLNTEVADTGNFASIASSVITLEAGTYRFKARAPAYAVNSHKLRLANITDSIYFYGSNAFSSVTNTSWCDAWVSGRFTITSQKTFELQHYSQSSQSTNGLGAVVSGPAVIEVYSEIEFWKEKV